MHTKLVNRIVFAQLMVAALLLSHPLNVSALTSKSGAVGIQATVPGVAPSKAPTIAVPSSGQVFTSIPITVNGLCSSGLLVKVFANNVFIGSAVCGSGSYQLQADLFSGANDLVARQYDALDQASPDSNVVHVTFTSAEFLNIASQVQLTSDYAERGANPGDELDWPITITGGTPPYALSVDWGDGSSADLKSVNFAGPLTVKHIYKSAGTYMVIMKATDTKGSTAFLQVVGVANGAVQAAGASGKSQVLTRTVLIWWPLLLCIPLLLVAFWLGRRHELYTLRKHLES